MKISKLIKEELRKIIKELSVDEPKGGPFGKVLFSPDRIDNVVKTEPDAPLESELYKAIRSHQHSKGDDPLYDIFDDALKVAKSGKYKKLIQPPKNTSVYRLSTKVEIDDAAKYLGISKEELVTKYVDGKAHYIPLNGKQYSSRAKIQSWTTNLDYDSFTQLSMSSEDVAILFEASTSKNDFFMNPKLSSKVQGLTTFEKEYETVARNPVKLTGASFYVRLNKEYSDVLDDIRKRVQDINNNKELKEKIIDFLYNQDNSKYDLYKIPEIREINRYATGHNLLLWWDSNPKDGLVIDKLQKFHTDPTEAPEEVLHKLIESIKSKNP